MNILDIFKQKNNTYKNLTVEFHKAGIESQKVYSFIPYTSITRIWLGKLPSTITLKTILGAIMALVGFYLFSLSYLLGKFWGYLGFIAIVVGIIMVINSLKNWYALNIDMASGIVYSFSADNKDYTDKGYNLLLSALNEREENRQRQTLNFLTGDVTIIKGDDNQVIIGGENNSQTRS